MMPRMLASWLVFIFIVVGWGYLAWRVTHAAWELHVDACKTLVGDVNNGGDGAISRRFADSPEYKHCLEVLGKQTN